MLSPSTEKRDRTDKLGFRRSPPGVEAVLRVAPDQRRAQIHRREDERRLVRDRAGAERAERPALDARLTRDAG